MVGFFKRFFSGGGGSEAELVMGSAGSSYSFSDSLSFLRDSSPRMGQDGFRDFITLIEKLALTTPDISQALSRTVLLGNTGHEVTLEGLSEAEEGRAREEIKLFAREVHKTQGGVDGLVNKLFRQICITGALSGEWIPSESMDGVERVVIVPTRQISFRLREGEYIPFQSLDIEEVELNREQYMYIPVMSFENSPYGVPPYLAALYPVFIQKDGLENIAKLIRKFGLLGFLSARKKRPVLSFGRSEKEHEKELASRLKVFAKNLRNGFREGVAVSYDDVDYDYKSFGDSARGAQGVFHEVEQQVSSGLDIDPALLGRSYSTTETYAGVVYAAFLASLNNYRRMIRRFLERGYALHLVLKGFGVRSVRVHFNPDRGMKPVQDAQAMEVRTRTVLSKLQAGIIDEERAAQELGYAQAK